MARFRATARGPGLIPWLMDWDYEETRLLAQDGPAPWLGCRAGEAQALQARAQIGCPFDRHRLAPMPAPIPCGWARTNTPNAAGRV